MKDINLFRNDFNRRDFIKLSGMFMAALAIPISGFNSKDKWGSVLPTRKLGKTGLDATLLTIGTGSSGGTYEEIEAIIETANNGGCRFFDTARAYGRGSRETELGKFLTSKYRKEIILLSKSGAKNADDLNRDLETSLKELNTNCLDVYLIHTIVSIEDVDSRLNNGVLDAMLKAKEQGMVKHIGFSGHYDPDANIYLLDKNLPEIEVMMCPVNPVDPLRKSFVLNVLPKAVEKNVGIIGMKILGGGGLTGAPINWGGVRGEKRESVIPEIISFEDALHFAWSLPVSTTTLGCTNVQQVKMDIQYLHNFTGMSESKRNELTERLKEVAMRNNFEHYKMK
jgi:predicted aldo/keto reductase-like oxidoreductase